MFQHEGDQLTLNVPESCFLTPIRQSNRSYLMSQSDQFKLTHTILCRLLRHNRQLTTQFEGHYHPYVAQPRLIS